ncbi:unnamed protein product (macronuclear) [Paramecium tetraurelia]|uniref:Exonuclease domain-containing protein n=1 Tax=Paramecium tetraurelia TaxID=5888 RepID=A0CYN5_PARTE|nr:uncharacterized protein GSPATT00011503001 [Paramecium tetraurelia]CAK75902.1 unnamed protein product [Paramecium tetraurelia]|eukprot:XP_001443299.1 hypothetical protein (macronuclear) [Paramecium tetraurelia strain d4-2]
MICSENCQYPWQCMICDRVSDYFIKQCPGCQTPKEQFCRSMNTNCIILCINQDELNYQEQFQTIGIIEMECNQDRHKQEIIKLKISKISTKEIDDNEYFKKEFIIRPLTVPQIQSPQFQSVTQEQANDGVLFESTFQYLNDMDLVIFENRAKAQMFLNASKQNNLQCPIKQYIELKSVFPFQKPQLTMNDMLRWLKIPFSSQQFALTSVVIELLKRSYTFQTQMLQQLQFPIPEEQYRLQGFTNLILFDIQVSCIEDNRQNYNQEIIEISAKVYDIDQRKIVRNFQKYIKPVDNPIISEFCTKQTGIKQFQINNGISLQQAINQLTDIFKELGRFCIITKGDFDLLILKKEAQRKNIKLVRNFTYYINIKKVFPKSLRSKTSLKDPSMTEMLECCGLLQYDNHESETAKVDDLANLVDYLIFNENVRFDEKMLQYTCKI